VSASIAGLNIRYPVLLGTDKIEADFGVIGFPLTLVLTRNWTIYKWYLGHLPHKKELIEQQIELLLG